MESDSADSIETGRVCFGLQTLKTRLLCLPAPYLLEDNGKLQLDVTLKADDQAYQIANHVISQNVDKNFIAALFQDNNFQQVSGAISLRAIYAGTELSYTPLHMIGAFKLTNPSLPEVHFAGMRQSVLRITHNILVHDWFAHGWGDLVVTPSIFYYDRSFAYLDVDLLEASIARINTLIQITHHKSADADLSLAVLSRRSYLPSLSLRFENIANNKTCPTCDLRFFNIERYFATMAYVNASYSITHAIGQSMIGIDLPFFVPYRQLDSLKSTLAYAYRLAKIEGFASFSPLIYTFGFIFDADVYRLGIMYSDEKQDNRIQIERQKQTYVFTSFYL